MTSRHVQHSGNLTIAQVCPRYFPYLGGIETVVREVSERLASKGYHVEVLSTDPSNSLPKNEIINNVIVRRFWSWAPNDAYYFSPGLLRYLRKNSDSYDIIHAHGYHAFPALLAYYAKSKSRFVFSPHYHESGHTPFRTMLHIPYARVARRIFDGADQIVCVSDYERRLVKTNFSVDNNKLTVIPNGVNPEEFHAKRTDNYRKAILYVGRLEKYKGIEYLVQALPKVDERVRLEVVGQGPYMKSLTQMIKKLHLEDRVVLFGGLSRSQLLARYSEANAFVSLSTHEAFGITVAEALASGTPCIVARASGLQEFIDGKNCFGIDLPISTDALAQLISKVMLVRIDGVRLSTWDDVTFRLMSIYEKTA